MTGAPVSSPSRRAKVVLPLPAQPRMTIRATIVGYRKKFASVSTHSQS
jgi:hypothetical protein